MGEAKRKRNDWVRLFAPPLQIQIAISRPGARPVSTLKYEQSMIAFVNKPSAKPALSEMRRKTPSFRAGI
jgi:hypothetical protein